MIEIERKFLVVAGAWPAGDRQIRIRQGYMVNQDGMVVRVRQKNEQCYLSLKASIDTHSSYDFEYLIPADEAQTMFDHLCGGAVISKTRHEVSYGGMLWEIDEFHEENSGLVVAEVELATINQEVALPSWVAQEVSNDDRYRNSKLIQKPYCQW